jgi:integrase
VNKKRQVWCAQWRGPREEHPRSLPAIRLHDVRHSCATACLEAGIPAKVVSERLDLANIQITLDIYSQVRQQVDQEAADQAASFILGAG